MKNLLIVSAIITLMSMLLISCAAKESNKTEFIEDLKLEIFDLERKLSEQEEMINTYKLDIEQLKEQIATGTNDSKNLKEEYEALKSVVENTEKSIFEGLAPRYNEKMRIICESDLKPEIVFSSRETNNLPVPNYEVAGTVSQDNMIVPEHHPYQVNISFIDDVTYCGKIDDFPLKVYKEDNKLLFTLEGDNENQYIYAIRITDAQFSRDENEYNALVTEKEILFAYSSHIIRISTETGDVIDHVSFEESFFCEEFVFSGDGKNVSFIEWEKGFYISDITFENCYVFIERSEDIEKLDGSIARYPIFDQQNSNLIYILSLGYEWDYGVYSLNLVSKELSGILAQNVGHIYYCNGDEILFQVKYGYRLFYLDIAEMKIYEIV